MPFHPDRVCAILAGFAFRESRRNAIRASIRVSRAKSISERAYLFASQDFRILTERHGMTESAVMNLSLKGD